MLPLALAITVLFWVSLASLVFAVSHRAARWRLGRASPLIWRGLLAMPKRYFVDLHHVVSRDPFIAHAHIATAGGALLAAGLVAINYGLMLYLPWLDDAIACAALAMLAGVAAMAWRRRAPPARLSRGRWNRLPWKLGAFALGLLLLILIPVAALSGSVAVLVVLLLATGAYEMTLGAARGGPMKHAIAGLLHLAFHPRAERFATKGSAKPTALLPAALDQQVFGVGKPSDFRWNQLLSFDACVQCGKCEAACPAFAAGQPLNPKKLIQDLVAGMAGESDFAYTGSPSPGIAIGLHFGAPDQIIVPNLIAPETLWACTTCRACVQECPMLIEHVDAVVDLRRHQTLTLGAAPGKAPEVLANLRETATSGGYALGARYHWAVDLNVRQAAPGLAVDIVLMVGEGGYDMRYQRTLRSLVKVLQAAKIDFAVLGDLESDSGDLARRLGDEATFVMLARRNIELLGGLSFKRILTADPHLLHCLKNEYPALGGCYEVLHHTTFLAALAREQKIKLDDRPASDTKLTYHDPCYLGRYNGEIDAPRQLLAQLGFQVQEMARHGLQSRCCGGGGGAPISDIPGKYRIPDIRIEDARSIGADTVVVACPNCTTMLEGVVGPRPEVIDIAELVAAALEV